MPPAAGQPVAAPAAPAGISYDEIQKRFLGGRPEGPGHFDDDRKAIENRAQSTETAPDADPAAEAIEDVPNAADMVNAPGHLFHFSFLGDAWRVDDPLAGTATITKPDEVIQLDLLHYTYVRLTGDAARAAVASRSPVADELRAIGEAPAPPENTVTLDLEQHYRTLPSLKIDGLLVPGVELAQLILPVAHSKTCSVVDREVVDVIKFYDTRYAEHPLTAAERGSENARLAESVRVPGCRITYKKRTIDDGSEPGAGRLALYRVFATIVKGSGSGPAGFQFTVTASLVERANVRPLGPQDASIFEVPAGFTPATHGPSGQPPPAAPPAMPAPSPSPIAVERASASPSPSPAPTRTPTPSPSPSPVPSPSASPLPSESPPATPSPSSY